jgi:hypothetical protein
MPDTQLLCTFTYNPKLDETLSDITSTYEVARDQIFVLKNLREPEELFCTYNVEDQGYDSYLEKTISIHRKRDTNTLYTINALNKLIMHLNGGVLDKSFPIPWEDYENSLLVTNNGEFQKIDTQLHDIIELEETNGDEETGGE